MTFFGVRVLGRSMDGDVGGRLVVSLVSSSGVMSRRWGRPGRGRRRCRGRLRVSLPYALRAWAVLAIVLCGSCAGPRHAGHGSQPPQPSPGKPLGHSGCGPPITYQVFWKDAFGVDWSKANDLIAFNAKASDASPIFTRSNRMARTDSSWEWDLRASRNARPDRPCGAHPGDSSRLSPKTQRTQPTRWVPDRHATLFRIHPT